MPKPHKSNIRQQTKLDYCVGFHAVEAVLDNHPEQIVELFYDDTKPSQRQKQLIIKAKKARIVLRIAGRQVLDDICGCSRHQGVIAQLQATITGHASDLETIIETSNDNSVILILDQVQDPHNLGACLRTAECAGVHAVLLPKDNTCPVNQTVRKVASGAVESMNILYVPNLVSAMKKIQQSGYWVYGTSDQAPYDLYDCKFSGKVAIVMGAEGKGVRRLTAEHCDYLVSIPLYGKLSSLNVSVATGVTLFEVCRQR